jgi:hypothetical protein
MEETNSEAGRTTTLRYARQRTPTKQVSLFQDVTKTIRNISYTIIFSTFAAK